MWVVLFGLEYYLIFLFRMASSSSWLISEEIIEIVNRSDSDNNFSDDEGSEDKDYVYIHSEHEHDSDYDDDVNRESLAGTKIIF